MAREVLALFGKEESYLTFVPDRPGHDLRYALNNEKIRTHLGWQPSVDFREGLEKTVAWYQANAWWWQPLKQRLSRESKGFWSEK